MNPQWFCGCFMYSLQLCEIVNSFYLTKTPEIVDKKQYKEYTVDNKKSLFC